MGPLPQDDSVVGPVPLHDVRPQAACGTFLATMAARFLTVAAVVIGTLVSGCGYHLSGTLSTLPEELKTIRVDTFQNLTKWSDMDQRVVEAVTLEWVRRRRLEVVEGIADADLQLDGVIVSLRVSPVSFDEQGRATEYQMNLITSVRLEDVRGDEPELLWEDRAFSRRTSYLVDPRAVDYFDRQIEAMDELSEEYARALVSAVLEGF
jgi:outer membrane lipopolysaccharide assembly protein LptE/RlpB